jgi:tetratricopeptide (TPR) repeat protein
MSFCFNCFRKLETLREPCPYCSAPALKKEKSDPLELNPEDVRRLENLPQYELEGYVGEMEIDRLLKRGQQCYQQGKAWIAMKNRKNARKDFQRALKYYENVLRLDSSNNEAREFRGKCLQKMT